MRTMTRVTREGIGEKDEIKEMVCIASSSLERFELKNNKSILSGMVWCMRVVHGIESWKPFCPSVQSEFVLRLSVE